MERSIQESLKDLGVKRGPTPDQFAERTLLSESAPGSYEAENLTLHDNRVLNYCVDFRLHTFYLSHFANVTYKHMQGL